MSYRSGCPRRIQRRSTGGGGSTVVNRSSYQAPRWTVGRRIFSTHTGTASNAQSGTRKSAEDLAYFSSTDLRSALPGVGGAVGTVEYRRVWWWAKWTSPAEVLQNGQLTTEGRGIADNGWRCLHCYKVERVDGTERRFAHAGPFEVQLSDAARLQTRPDDHAERVPEG